MSGNDAPGALRRARMALSCAIVLMFLLVGLPAVLLAEEYGPKGTVPNTDSEPNNTMVEATLIDTGSTQLTGSVTPSDPDDYYKILLKSDEFNRIADLLTVQVQFDSWTAESSATIIDPLGFILDTRSGVNLTLNALTAPDLQGTFYIHLHVVRGPSNYILKTDVVSKPYTAQDKNNQPDNAQFIPALNPDRPAGNLSGDAEPSDYQDFYMFRLESLGQKEPGFVSIHMSTGPNAMFRLELYDTYMMLLAPKRELSDPVAGATSVISYITDEPQDLFLRVWAANGTGDYLLTVYMLTIKDLPDDDIAHSLPIIFNGTDQHSTEMTDALGFDTYVPEQSDIADLWTIDVAAGAVLKVKVLSRQFDLQTGLPGMVLRAFNANGTPYQFSGSGEHIEPLMDPDAEMAFLPERDSTIFFGVFLEGDAPGGGGFTIDIFRDSPPLVVEGIGPTNGFKMSDEAPVELLDLKELFHDREGDRLVYSYSLEDPDLTLIEEGLVVELTDDDRVVLDPYPRFHGSGRLVLSATEMDYGVSTDVSFNISIGSCGCHNVEVLPPYDMSLAFPDPVVLTYGVHETDTSIDLSRVFKDPLGHIIEVSVEGDGVSTVMSAVIEDTGLTNGTGPGSDAPLLGMHLERAIVDGAFIITPGRNPVTSGVPSTLVISLTPEAKAQERQMLSKVMLTAWPFDDNTAEASPSVKLLLKVQKGPGHAPKWALPGSIMVQEDEGLNLVLDDYSHDIDLSDKGNLTYKVIPGDLNVSVGQTGRDGFVLMPSPNWCGVEDLTFKVTDSYGLSDTDHVALEVMCVNDGPKLLIASPHSEQRLEVFEGEEVVFSVLVRDVDTGPWALVYDWYINDYPLMAGGSQTLRFVPDLGLPWAANLTININIGVQVTNSVTGMTLSTNWTIVVKHINQPPNAQIDAQAIGKETTVGQEVRFLGRGSDPERSKLIYRWDFGDGSSAIGPQVTHTYDNPGKYVATLVVSDGEYSAYAHINVSVKAQVLVVATPRTFNSAVGVWIGAIILMVALFGIGSTEPSKYRLFLLFTIFYTKLRGTEVLDHYLRGRIQGYITANPGAHYNMIKGDLQINNGNLAYHLKVLERQGYIKSVRDGIYKRFYPETMKVMRPPSLQERILVLLRSHPGLSQRDIARMLDQSQSTINDYIRRMSEAHLLKVEKSGVTNHCFVLEMD